MICFDLDGSKVAAVNTQQPPQKVLPKPYARSATAKNMSEITKVQRQQDAERDKFLEQLRTGFPLRKTVTKDKSCPRYQGTTITVDDQRVDTDPGTAGKIVN